MMASTVSVLVPRGVRSVTISVSVRVLPLVVMSQRSVIRLSGSA